MNLPVSSHRAIGFDSEPWLFPDTGERSSYPSYRVRCFLAPRPEKTHLPVAPCDLFVAFREDWDEVGGEGNMDLGEFAEDKLSNMTSPTSREERLFHRFLSLVASVLPRPIQEYELRYGIVRKAA